MNYKEILEKANKAAKESTFIIEGEDVMIYPCGFANVYFEKGKRNPVGKAMFEQELVDWDDYRKCYYIWISEEYNQSYNHKRRHADILAKILTEKLGVPVYSTGRLD